MGQAESDRFTAGQHSAEQLERLFVIYDLKPWKCDRLSYVRSMRKGFVADPELIVGTPGTTPEQNRLNGKVDGKLIETFVAAHLRAELPLSVRSPKMYSWRSRDGRRSWT